MTLPDYQTACGCTDIMMHTMERYFTNGGNMELTDALAEGLLRTVKNNAVILMILRIMMHELKSCGQGASLTTGSQAAVMTAVTG